MPSLSIQINVALTDELVSALQQECAAAISAHKGDPIANISVAVTTGAAVRFGTSDDPCAILHLHTLEMSATVTSALTQAFTEQLGKLGVTPRRMYAFFHEVPHPRLIGWGGDTAAVHLERRRKGRAPLGLYALDELEARGQLIHSDGTPLSSLDLELWELDDGEPSRQLAAGSTDATGNFIMRYEARGGRFGDLPDIALLLYEPDFHRTLAGRQVRHRVLGRIIPARENHGLDGWDLGQHRVAWYQYHPGFPFPYTDYSSVSLRFQGGAATAFARSGALSASVAGPLYKKLESGASVTQDEVQAAFSRQYGPPKTTQAPYAGTARTPSGLVDRLLNGFGPQLFEKHLVEERWRWAYGWREFALDGSFDLPDWSLEFKRDGDTFAVIRIQLDFRDGRGLQTFTPPSAEFDQAMRVVRGNQFNVVSQVKGHVAQSHFNLEQYAIAFFRHVRKSPLRQLLFPHLREVIQINTNGQRTLLDSQSGALPGRVPIRIEPIVQRWLPDTIGEMDWRGFRPRAALGPSHRYALAANAYWDLLLRYTRAYLEPRMGQVAECWNEVEAMSADLVSHSVPVCRANIDRAGVPDAGDWTWYDSSERIPDDGRSLAVSPVSGQSDEDKLGELTQLATYIIYMSSFFHSWFHQEMMNDLAETRFASVLRNGSLAPESDDRVLPDVATTTRTLATLNTIANFDFGFIERDEDGELSDLRNYLLSDSVLRELMDIGTLRSRMNA